MIIYQTKRHKDHSRRFSFSSEANFIAKIIEKHMGRAQLVPRDSNVTVLAAMLVYHNKRR